MTWYYKFTDNYECWSCYRLRGVDKFAEERKHGKVVVEKRLR